MTLTGLNPSSSVNAIDDVLVISDLLTDLFDVVSGHHTRGQSEASGIAQEQIMYDFLPCK